VKAKEICGFKSLASVLEARAPSNLKRRDERPAARRFSDFGKRLRSADKCFHADVGVAVAHGRAFMANQGHDDGVGYPGILEQ
jgi:hypothetical protein